MIARRAAALVLGLLVFAGSAAIASASPSEEAEFVTLMNQSRAQAGLAPLTLHNDLVAGARAHTAEMVAAGSIFHSTSAQLSAVTTGWSVLGENVGKGPDPSVLHQAFMASPSHQANILGTFDRVGVGAARDSAGKLYVTVLFMKEAAPQPTTTTAPPTTTSTTLTTTPVPTVPSPAPEPTRPRGAAVSRDDASPRTLGLELFHRVGWVEGTYCVTIRADGAICVE